MDPRVTAGRVRTEVSIAAARERVEVVYSVAVILSVIAEEKASISTAWNNVMREDSLSRPGSVTAKRSEDSFLPTARARKELDAPVVVEKGETAAAPATEAGTTTLMGVPENAFA